MTHSSDDSKRQAEANIAAAHSGPGYETKDTSVRAIVIFLVGLFSSLFLIQVALWYMLKELETESGLKTISAKEASPPPAFQYPVTSALKEQLDTLHELEKELLNNYGWQNKNKGDQGEIRVPIEQAINLIADRGLPAYSGKPQTESMVNSHSGVAQPMDDKGKLKPDDKTKPDGGAKP